MRIERIVIQSDLTGLNDFQADIVAAVIAAEIQCTFKVIEEEHHYENLPAIELIFTKEVSVLLVENCGHIEVMLERTHQERKLLFKALTVSDLVAKLGPAVLKEEIKNVAALSKLFFGNKDQQVSIPKP